MGGFRQIASRVDADHLATGEHAAEGPRDDVDHRRHDGRLDATHRRGHGTGFDAGEHALRVARDGAHTNHVGRHVGSASSKARRVPGLRRLEVAAGVAADGRDGEVVRVGKREPNGFFERVQHARAGERVERHILVRSARGARVHPHPARPWWRVERHFAWNPALTLAHPGPRNFALPTTSLACHNYLHTGVYH